MAYLIHGQISSRQKIELGVLGPSANKPSWSVSSSACPEYVVIILSFGGNYWGEYGHFVLFAIIVNNSVVVIFAISCFVHHVHVMSSLKYCTYHDTPMLRFSVILLQTCLKGTFGIMLQGSQQTQSKNFMNTRAIIDFNDLVIIIISHHHHKNDDTFV